MAMGFTVVVRSDQVEIRDNHKVVQRFVGKWASFYGTLALIEGRILDQYSVCNLRLWPDDALKNGREISRHLNSKKLSKLTLPLVLSDQPTKRWRLNPNYDVETDTQNADTLLGEFQKTKVRDLELNTQHALSDVFAIAEAQLLFHEGHLRDCHRLAYAVVQRSSNTELQAIAAFWSWQSAMRLPGEDHLLDEAEHCSEIIENANPSPITDFIKDRYKSMVAFFSPREEWAQRVQNLDVLARTPKPSRDLSSWAYANNYAALLHRRLGEISTAESRISVALAPALACGDMYFIQAVLFNLGIILCDAAAAEKTATRDELKRGFGVEALQLDSRITKVLGIGKNTAQNEIFIAEIHTKAGDRYAALDMIIAARKLVKVNHNALDLADLKMCEAGFVAKFSAGNKKEIQKAVALYLEAEELFTACNREDRRQTAISHRALLSVAPKAAN